MKTTIRVTSIAFDPAEELRCFEAESGDNGAVVTFLGKVRKEDESTPVEALTLEHYPGLTEQSIEAACAEAGGRWPLGEILIIHRVGRMRPGEPIVQVITSSPHRRAAFEATDFLMDYLKTKALFWKKETRQGKDRWIEPRPEDHDDAARWSE
jgi:molybdopterin synthase catalytic subunit